MNKDAIEEEILVPPGLGAELVSYGLVPVEINIDEFFLAQQYGASYSRLSTHDRIALAIAKSQSLTLLTGDGALRKAAVQEGLRVMGTLGIIDQLWEYELINAEEMKSCLEQLKVHNGGAVRLPKAELERRLSVFVDNS